VGWGGLLLSSLSPPLTRFGWHALVWASRRPICRTRCNGAPLRLLHAVRRCTGCCGSRRRRASPLSTSASAAIVAPLRPCAGESPLRTGTCRRPMLWLYLMMTSGLGGGGGGGAGIGEARGAPPQGALPPAPPPALPSKPVQQESMSSPSQHASNPPPQGEPEALKVCGWVGVSGSRSPPSFHPSPTKNSINTRLHARSSDSVPSSRDSDGGTTAFDSDGACVPRAHGYKVVHTRAGASTPHPSRCTGIVWAPSALRRTAPLSLYSG
jgi:hypothetical protein